jgi:hypothetical protein
MKLSIARNITGIISLLILVACDSNNSAFIPYDLRGMDAYVYNNNTDEEFYAGHVEGKYFSKGETLSKCQSLAHSVAREKHLKNWSYICCTVTPSSSCATKVK